METFLIFVLLIVLAVLVISVITLNGISEYRKGYRNGINDGLDRAKEIIKQKRNSRALRTRAMLSINKRYPGANNPGVFFCIYKIYY